MKPMKELSVAAVAIGLAALWAAPSAALDPTKCKAKINAKDGVILVETKTVSGTLLWGPAAGKEIFALFDNTGDCVNPDPKKCQLGAVSTPEQLSPPEGCRVYLKDTGDASTCSAYIKKCVPGRRPPVRHGGWRRLLHRQVRGQRVGQPDGGDPIRYRVHRQLSVYR